MKAEENHIDYFKFIDSFAERGCPLCSYVLLKKEGYYQNLLYEGINDKYLRRDFIVAGGFCAHHTYELLDRRENISIAVLCDQIYIHAVGRIFQKAGRDREADEGKTCMLCVAIDTWTRMFLSLFKKHAPEDELKSKTVGSEGFCLPHITRLQKAVRRLPAWFTDFQKSAFDGRRARVRAYIDGSNFSVGGDAAEHTSVVKELIRTLYGHEGAR